jgi:hypothetical protein
MRAGGKWEGDLALSCLRQLAVVSDELHASVSRFAESMAGKESLPYQQLLPLRRRLEVIEQISTALRELNRHGHLFRRVEARALYAEGMTMSQLAYVFGVSRQRVSALLREPVELPGAAKPGEAPEVGG